MPPEQLNPMKLTLKLEELAQLLACLVYLTSTDAAWWSYALLLVGPDAGMVGYLINARVGAVTYNVLHHKGLAAVVLAGGLLLSTGWLVAMGVLLYGHSSLDRMLGFGLKHADDFRHTHLGWIGK